MEEATIPGVSIARMMIFRHLPSVGSVGGIHDNALAETINGLDKAKLIDRRSLRRFEAVEFATLT